MVCNAWWKSEVVYSYGPISSSKLQKKEVTEEGQKYKFEQRVTYNFPDIMNNCYFFALSNFC